MKKNHLYIIVIAVIAVAAYIFYTQQDSSNNYSTTDATIYKIDYITQPEGGNNVYYLFYANGKTQIQSKQLVKVIPAMIDSLIGKTVPCIYAEKNPANSKLLLVPRNWQDHGLPYPDTLQWLDKYIDMKATVLSN